MDKSNATSLKKATTILTPDILAAYAFVDEMVRRTDGHVCIAPFWHGWALREAFIAGAKWQNQQPKDSEQ